MIRVSDYIADCFADHGVKTVFTVVGGGAMYLNDSFGHHNKIRCIYNHHEQASAMAAEAYFRVNNFMAGLCVTSGPGAINALNGVCGAYQDSIPMIVVSGQVKSTLTVKNSGLKLRTLGGQEFNIISALPEMTKYAVMVDSAEDIRYCIEKAFDIALSDRPGPCWLDIPLDIQGTMIEPNELRGYDKRQSDELAKADLLRWDNIDEIIRRLKAAKRPILYAGNGIRIAGAAKELHEFVSSTGIPVVTCWDSIDLMESDDSNYCGRGGTMGDRAGNFAVQNSDFLVCIGSRLSIYQVGYNVDIWARAAYVVDVDIDPEELKKPTIRVDMPVCMDAKVFLGKMIENCKDYKAPKSWKEQCLKWKDRYPVVLQRQYDEKGKTNVYAFIDCLSRLLPEMAITVVANGSASVVGSQAYHIEKGQRFIMNCAISSMGYDLPASIGVAEAVKDVDSRQVVCIAGDGSIQMNLQELQTIVTNKLPIKIFVINNEGYHQIKQTQDNMFGNSLVGVGPASGDLGFPDFEKLAVAYGIPYDRINDNTQLAEKIEGILRLNSYFLCEVMCSTSQNFEPKSSAKRLDDGTIVSPPLEDMAPFLPREELKENMYIPLLE